MQLREHRAEPAQADVLHQPAFRALLDIGHRRRGLVHQALGFIGDEAIGVDVALLPFHVVSRIGGASTRIQAREHHGARHVGKAVHDRQPPVGRQTGPLAFWGREAPVKQQVL